MTSRRKGHACMAWNAFVFRGNLASLALAQCPLTILLYGHEVSCRAAGVVGGTVHHTTGGFAVRAFASAGVGVCRVT